jgi:hypothetical protein
MVGGTRATLVGAVQTMAHVWRAISESLTLHHRPTRTQNARSGVAWLELTRFDGQVVTRLDGRRCAMRSPSRWG